MLDKAHKRGELERRRPLFGQEQQKTPGGFDDGADVGGFLQLGPQNLLQIAGQILEMKWLGHRRLARRREDLRDLRGGFDRVRTAGGFHLRHSGWN